MADPSVALAVATTFGLYLTALLASGLVLNAAAFSSVRQIVPWRAWGIALTFGAVAFSLLGFAVRAMALTGELSGMWNADMLSLLWQSPVGEALRLRLVCLGLVATGLAVPRAGLIVSLVGVGGIFWSFASIGHLSEASMGLRSLLVLHLAVAAFWVGVIWPLHWLLSDAARQDHATHLAEAFGQIAFLLVPLMLLAGVVMAWQLVGSVANLTTAYGLTLLTKAALVTFLLRLSAMNKLRLVPQLRAGDPFARSRLIKSVRFEAVAFGAIFAVTAVLTSAASLPVYSGF